MSANNQPQIALDFDLVDARGNPIGCMTLALSLAKNALPYTIDRLRACGWRGKNILELAGVETQDVTVDVFIQKDLQGRDRARGEIVTGAGALTFKMKNPIPVARLDAFAAYVTRGIDAMPPPKPVATEDAQQPADARNDDEIPF